MVVRFDDLQLAIVRGEEFFDVFRSLIVHYIQFGFETFLFQLLEVRLVRLEYAHVVQTRDGRGEDGIGLVMEQNEETHTAVERHKGKRSREIVIHDPTLFVGERPKAEDVGDGVVFVVGDEIRPGWEMVMRMRCIVNR